MMKENNPPVRLTMILFSLCLLLTLSASAFSQTILISGEGGYAQNTFGNGSTQNRVVYGLSISAILGGNADKNFAVQFPVYGELKAAGIPGESYADLMLGGDFAFRYKNFSAGPGANYGYIFREDVADRTCLGLPVRLDSSCTSSGNGTGNDGMREIGSINAFGLSGFAKYHFGPQGRAFIQGRYTYYGPSFVHLMNRNEMLSHSTVDLTAFNLPPIPDIADYPEFDNGRDIRITAGYIFHGGKFVRAQYTDRQLNFTPVLGNTTGVFNQQSRTFTIGGGFVF